ncbi:molybdenum ABC transporter ATP-binding protein [Candidatus Poribacteria bacterium]|nr:MAG: molybdenum ABC transporter ATP-binding protein [Candidatus Poribacteria bacterium]
MTDSTEIRLDFRKSLGSFTLEVNCTLETKVSAFLGVSGSGKSTLLNCVSGTLTPDEGEIAFGDEILYKSAAKINLPPEKRRFGYIFQEGYLFPHLTVAQNIRYGQPNPRKYSDAIDVLEISELLQRYPKELSGGQRQRVAIARALAMEPRMLLMDEPLAALDSALKNRIIPYLHHIKEAFETPILYVTHAFSEAMALADEAFLIADGEIMARGEPHQLLTAPSAMPIAQLTGVENILLLPVIASDKVRGLTSLEIGAQSLVIPYIEAEVGEVVPVAIRAEDIIISLEPNLTISARNILLGKIQYLDVRSERTWLSILVEWHHLAVKITHEAREALELRENMEVYCVIKASAINRLWD